jgi:CheY-like chemotaxis protein
MHQCLFLTKDLLFPSRIGHALEQDGWQLSVLPDSEPLLAACRRESVDVILLDLTYPNLDVPQLVAHLNGLEQPPRAIVAFGPHVHGALLQAAREAGCDCVVTRGEMSRRASSILAHCMGGDAG